MLFAALGQQVKHPATGAHQPIDTAPLIREAQYFDPVQTLVSCGPVMNTSHSLFFAVGDSGGSNFNTIHFEVVQ